MICSVVLAAGRSRRMGTQKLLLPFAGRTVIGHIVDRVIESGIDRVYAVVERDTPAVAEALARRPVEIVINPLPDSEMLDSVRCGLRALPPACRAVLVALGDQPAITPELVNALVAAFEASDRGIAVPVHDGNRGHPLLLSISYRERILNGYDDVGLRGLLRDHPEDVLEVPVASPAAITDMDHPEDYLRELRRLRSDDAHERDTSTPGGAECEASGPP